jgi:hypothetical protein
MCTSNNGICQTRGEDSFRIAARAPTGCYVWADDRKVCSVFC